MADCDRMPAVGHGRLASYGAHRFRPLHHAGGVDRNDRFYLRAPFWDFSSAELRLAVLRIRCPAANESASSVR